MRIGSRTAIIMYEERSKRVTAGLELKRAFLAAMMTRDGSLIQGYDYIYFCCVDDEDNCSGSHGYGICCDNYEGWIHHRVLDLTYVVFENWMVSPLAWTGGRMETKTMMKMITFNNRAFHNPRCLLTSFPSCFSIVVHQAL